MIALKHVCLVLAVGSTTYLAPSLALAKGWLFNKHSFSHGTGYMTYSVAPAASFGFTQVTPAASFGFTQVTPAASYGLVPVTPASSFGLVPVAPASSFGLAGLATRSNAQASMDSLAMASLSAGAYRSIGTSASDQGASSFRALSQASAASVDETVRAARSYPQLASQGDGLIGNGGRFVLFLKNLLREEIRETGSREGARSRIARVLGLINPGSLLAVEVERLISEVLGEVLGVDSSGGGPTGSETTITIRITCEGGGTAVVDSGNGGNTGNLGAGGGSGEVGPAPLFAPRPAASGQSSTPQGPSAAPQAGGSGSRAGTLPRVQPAPLDDDAAPPAPNAPVPGLAPGTSPQPVPSGEDSAEARHREILEALGGVNESLRVIAEHLAAPPAS